MDSLCVGGGASAGWHIVDGEEKRSVHRLGSSLQPEVVAALNPQSMIGYLNTGDSSEFSEMSMNVGWFSRIRSINQRVSRPYLITAHHDLCNGRAIGGLQDELIEDIVDAVDAFA
jgi:hypothetical protein